MQVPLQGLWAVGYCWNVNWNVLVVFWLYLVVVFSDTVLSLLGLVFPIDVFERINAGIVGLERGSSTASKEPGGTTMAVVNLWLARDTLDANIGECCLDLECCFFFRIQENHSFNRQSFPENPRRGCC